MKTSARWLAIVAASLLMACGGDDGPTAGSQCKQVMTAYCQRAANPCQFFTTSDVPDCVSAGLEGCCASQCGVKVVSTQQEIDACVAAMNATSCSNLDPESANLALPTSCQGVVQTALTQSSSLRTGQSAPAATTPAAQRVGAKLSK